ncbi:unnamed protein product [Dovyalis caffra]|uniref:COX assembly mitochondrial protein n=1 Tax=Dovyalis caffra TaxID=77055 RepID=A0AAV1RMK1_9ROSI|nr:unnamed protein product [Dovyalis caffra]
MEVAQNEDHYYIYDTSILSLMILSEMARQMDCERLHKALCDCHRRVPAGRGRETACRHLNRALAECMVAVVCPDESEAVRSLCSSGGTKLKRSQCQEAQLALSVFGFSNEYHVRITIGQTLQKHYTSIWWLPRIWVLLVLKGTGKPA